MPLTVRIYAVARARASEIARVVVSTQSTVQATAAALLPLRWLRVSYVEAGTGLRRESHSSFKLQSSRVASDGVSGTCRFGQSSRELSGDRGTEIIDPVTAGAAQHPARERKSRLHSHTRDGQVGVQALGSSRKLCADVPRFVTVAEAPLELVIYSSPASSEHSRSHRARERRTWRSALERTAHRRHSD